MKRAVFFQVSGRSGGRLRKSSLCNRASERDEFKKKIRQMRPSDQRSCTIRSVPKKSKKKNQHNRQPVRSSPNEALRFSSLGSLLFRTSRYPPATTRSAYSDKAEAATRFRQGDALIVQRPCLCLFASTAPILTAAATAVAIAARLHLSLKFTVLPLCVTIFSPGSRGHCADTQSHAKTFRRSARFICLLCEHGPV